MIKNSIKLAFDKVIKMNEYQLVNDKIIKNSVLYSINRMGTGKVSPDFHIKRSRAYPFCTIHYIDNGSGYLEVNGKHYTVNKGELFIINAYEEHQYWTSSEKPMELTWLEFSGGDSINIIQYYLLNNSPVLSNALIGDIKELLVNLMNIAYRESFNNEYDISEMIYHILLKIISNDKSGDNSRNISTGGLSIQRTLQYIDQNLGENLCVEKLSAISNFNSSYFMKLFKNVVGMPVAKYILKKRVQKAKKELTSGNLPIEVIAERLGFCNGSHFIRLFKQEEGLTPLEYRKQSIQYLYIHQS